MRNYSKHVFLNAFLNTCLSKPHIFLTYSFLYCGLAACYKRQCFHARSSIMLLYFLNALSQNLTFISISLVVYFYCFLCTPLWYHQLFPRSFQILRKWHIGKCRITSEAFFMGIFPDSYNCFESCSQVFQHVCVHSWLDMCKDAAKAGSSSQSSHVWVVKDPDALMSQRYWLYMYFEGFSQLYTSVFTMLHDIL